MRDWTRGELQAFSAAAKFLIGFGILVAVLAINERNYLWTAAAAIGVMAGLTLGIWLIRYQKRTGKSPRPFDK